MLGKRVSVAALSACLAFLIGVSGAQASVTYLQSFGSSGADAGQFSQPSGVAINEASGHIYVADSGNHRIQELDSTGAFVRMWGKGVNQSTGANLCTATSGDVCQAGVGSSAAAAFSSPRGIGVDPTTGAVYVQDAGNNRIQKFEADGTFVLLWGKAVDQQNGGNFCTAASGHTCKAGEISGVPATTTTPAVASEDGAFAGWGTGGLNADAPDLTVDEQGYVYVVDPHAVPNPRIQKFDSGGGFVAKVGPSDAAQSDLENVLRFPGGPAVSETGDVYVADDSIVLQFDPSDFSAIGNAKYRRVYGVNSDLARVAIDPHNQYLLTLGKGCTGKPGVGGTHIVEYHPSTEEVDCTIPTSPAIDEDGGLAVSKSHRLYVTDPAADQVHVFETPVAALPGVEDQRTSEITSSGVRINAEIAANLGETTFRVEYGTSPCSSGPCASSDESDGLGASYAPKTASAQVNGLSPSTTYYYRVVATNEAGSTEGPDRIFTTFASPSLDNSCPNNLARQQTGAVFLLDCRAYELVSAEDQGGYNVESDLVSGQSPFGGYPLAKGKALYAVHNGGIPGTGNPTNRGPDPYVATRNADEKRWVSKYVGIPASAPSFTPFSSAVAGADSSLSSFAFGGPDSCDPCFGDGTSGIPLRKADGTLAQGMKGPVSVLDPQPAGEVRKPLSPDGSHFVFASMQKFTADGNESGTDVTIYDRNLITGVTRAVSKSPGATTLASGEDIAQLDISSDGTRILIGERVSEDSEGNSYWRLYMHIGGAPNTIELAPGATDGVLYAGMSASGTKVYFSTKDALTTTSDQDTDESADIYRSDVATSSATLARVSVGSGTGDSDDCDPAANSARIHWNTIAAPADCSAVAIGGGGGVASQEGSIYFLSPEQLDGSEGEQDAPNLYLARPGSAPQFVATLESSLNAPLKPEEHLLQRSFGSFSYPEGVAIDRLTGATYVLDTLATTNSATPGAFVQKLDSEGKPDPSFGSAGRIDGSSSAAGPFLALGIGLSPSDPTGLPTQVAVNNNSASPNYRDLYVPDFGNRVIDRFGPSGNYKSQILLGFSFPTGVAVDHTTGNVFVSAFGSESQIRSFQAGGTPIGSFQVPAIPLGVAVDAGTVYVVDGKSTRVYNSGGTFLKTLDPNPSFGVAVDPVDHHVYVDEGDQVVEFDASGAQVGSPIGAGVLSDSVSLAADSGRLVISNPGSGNVAAYGAPAIPPDSGYDNPLVLDSVEGPEARHTADFQLTPSGDHAVFSSAADITGFDNAGRYEVFRYDAIGDQLACASCNTTDTPPATDASLASSGLSITDDGRVFFTSAEPLVLRDTNSRKDAYEWSEGKVGLISSGKSNFDSGLLSVSADGIDVLFFTRDTLAPNDDNGALMKIYDAREEGGFFTIAPPLPCAASDECHGPGSPRPPAPAIATVTGRGGNEAPVVKKPAKPCKRNQVKRRGKCVKANKKNKRAERRRSR